MNNSWKILFAKLIYIAFITIVYFLIGILLNIVIFETFGDFNINGHINKSTFLIGCELVAYLFLFTILAYITRNLVENIPFPLYKEIGFDKFKVKEISGLLILSFTLVVFSNNFSKKITYFMNRLHNGINYHRN